MFVKNFLFVVKKYYLLLFLSLLLTLEIGDFKDICTALTCS